MPSILCIYAFYLLSKNWLAANIYQWANVFIKNK